MTTINFAKRTHGLGTSVPSNKPQPSYTSGCTSVTLPLEDIEQMLSKYPPAKLRPPNPVNMYERHIRPQKAGGQA